MIGVERSEVPWLKLVARGTAAAVLTGAAVGGLCWWVASSGAAYATWLFVGLPLLMGVAASLAINWRRVEEGSHGVGIAAFAYVLAALLLLGIQMEGVICLIMAAPIYFPVFWIGYFATRALLKARREKGRAALLTFVPVLVVGSLIGARSTPAEGVRTQSTTMEIDAPPEAIWPYLLRMEKIPAPRSTSFRLGVAHPMAVRSSGSVVGSARECVLSTGTMTERIVGSEPGRKLAFDVLHTPATMREINPFGQVRASHLHGYFNVRRGEFRLEPLPGGRTRVIGTSRYSLRIYPVAYWDLWADDIVDEIHVAVIGEIKRRVEAGRSRSAIRDES